MRVDGRVMVWIEKENLKKLKKGSNIVIMVMVMWSEDFGATVRHLMSKSEPLTPLENKTKYFI